MSPPPCSRSRMSESRVATTNASTPPPRPMVWRLEWKGGESGVGGVDTADPLRPITRFSPTHQTTPVKFTDSGGGQLRGGPQRRRRFVAPVARPGLGFSRRSASGFQPLRTGRRVDQATASGGPGPGLAILRSPSPSHGWQGLGARVAAWRGIDLLPLSLLSAVWCLFRRGREDL